MSPKYNISVGLRQVIEWFICRLYLNVNDTFEYGLMSEPVRRISDLQINEFFKEFGNLDVYERDIFDQKFRI